MVFGVIFDEDFRTEGKDLGGVLPDGVDKVSPQSPSALHELQSVSDIEVGLEGSLTEVAKSFECSMSSW